jgi:hypothetical protein
VPAAVVVGEPGSALMLSIASISACTAASVAASPSDNPL